jgi:Putative Ig domain
MTLPDPTLSRTLLNCGTEMTGYPPTGLPPGPTLDPIAADNRLNPQVPAPIVGIAITGSAPTLTLTWDVDLGATDPLGWTGGTLPTPPVPVGTGQGYIDQSANYVMVAYPTPTTYNVYQVVRQPGMSPTYVFVKNVSTKTTTVTIPTTPGVYEFTITGVVPAQTTAGGTYGGEGAHPRTWPQFVIPNPTDVVVVTNPGNQTNVVGDTVSLAIVASDSHSGALSYVATGLPAGLSISSSTGIITGTPTTPSAPVVIVTVTNTTTNAVGSQSFTWTVNNVPAPAAPTGLGQAPGTPPQTQVVLTWTASSGSPAATTYNIYDTTGGAPSRVGTVTAPTVTFTATNGVANTTRTYAVSALNGTSESAMTSNVTVNFPVNVPGVPTGVSSANITTTAVDLTWVAPSGGQAPTGYNVYDVTSAHPGTKLTGSPVAAPTVTYHVTNGVTATTRKYAVTSVDAGGESAQTADFSVTFS